MAFRIKKKGFTLIELIIVAGIIFALTSIAIPNILKARMAANDVMAQAALKTISKALEQYQIYNDGYPPSPDELRNTQPPYINQDYFTGTHAGFTYSHAIAAVSYAVTAIP